MKRITFIIAALICTIGKAVADEVVVDNITIPQGGKAILNVCSSITSGNVYTGFQFDISLPDGVTTEKNEMTVPIVTKGALLSDHVITPSLVSSGDDRMVVVSFSKTPLAGNEGVLLSVILNSDASLSVGEKLIATIKNITFTTTDVENTPFDDLTFTITIGEPADTRVVIDEDATTAPEDATGVDVRVKRSIKAGTWNTICLPFAMTEAQVQEAFGSDVELADFEGITSDTDADDNITDITVNFSAATSIEPNHPYLIKVSTAVTEFTVDGVDIVVEEEPSIDKDGYTVGKGKTAVTFYNRMVGTYTTSGMVPNLCLFLSNGQFWYSKGITPMKGLRAYFDFYDVLTDVENTYSIKMRVDDTTTRINFPATTQIKEEGAMYDLSGRRLSIEHRKGITIINGKKVLEK